MTFKVDLSVTAAADPIASPTGLGSGKTRFSILDASGATVQTADVDGLITSFGGLADGNFTASAQLLDTAGALLGDAVTTSFVDGQETPPAGATFTPLAGISAVVSQE